MTFPELLILRHGETEWNRAGRMQGAQDSPLTELGCAQAARQGDILQGFGIDQWLRYCSPQGRAAHTARIALPAAEITEDARLCEIGLGDWTGKLRSEIAALAPHLFENDGLGWYDHAPGGEGLDGLHARAAAFLADLSAPSVIVTHGITSRVLRCVAQGLPVDAFETLGGGQGVVYHICRGKSELLA